MSTPFEIRQIVQSDLNWIAHFLDERWGSTKVVSRGQAYYAHELPGFLALEEDEPVGLVTCRFEGEECEIVTIDSTHEGIGIGTALLDAAKELATLNECKRIWLVTTNDNLPALRFLQKRRFRLVAIHNNALRDSRKLKPEIPLVGREGIPLHDEIELELVL